MDVDALQPLPEGAVLVHIGPYKTGTTAIQSALHQHRAELLAHGVLYPGTRSRHRRPVYALTEDTMPGVAPVPIAEWEELVGEVRRTSAPRAVISSEDFVRARPEHLDRLVADLGREHVHVLMVARSLDRLLPSAWQQRVKSINEARPYGEWLREVLDPERAGESARTFWRNQGIPGQVAAWTRVVPADQVVVVVADPVDRAQLRRVFEGLLGLPRGTLTEGARPNTSLTWERVELYRRVNQLFKDHQWDLAWQRRLLHRGMLPSLRDADQSADEHPIPSLPPWASEQVAQQSRKLAEQILGSGARVVGDVSRLEPTDAVGSDRADPETLPMEVAIDAIEGILDSVAEDRARRREQRRRRRGGE